VQAVKADVSAKRAAAFLKRMLQVALHQPSNAACASLLVASELLKAKAPLWPSLTQPEDSFAAEARDAPEDDAADMAALPPGADRSHAPAPSDSNLATSPAATGDTPQQEASGMRQASGNAAGWGVASWPPEDYYDMLKRTPQFARADRACCWEAALLATHAHPSVATFAQTLLAGTNIVYDGDPLKDLTLLAFLDKFVKRCATALLRS
jgi:ribosome biogenesis protein MAK21